MPVKPVPEGYHTLTPSLTVRNAERAIEFYKQAFGAEVRGGVAKGPDGKVMHAELKIGDSVIMLSDEYPEFGSKSPQSIGDSGMGLHIYLDNAEVRGGVAKGPDGKVMHAELKIGDSVIMLSDEYPEFG